MQAIEKVLVGERKLQLSSSCFPLRNGGFQNPGKRGSWLFFEPTLGVEGPSNTKEQSLPSMCVLPEVPRRPGP